MTREELERRFSGDGDLDEQALDDLVHDMKSIEASNINNEGIGAQLDYLLESGLTLDDVAKSLDSNTDAQE